VQRLYAGFVISFFAISTSGCATVTPVPGAPVPGAEKVKVTSSPGDVAACNAVGNIKVAKDGQGLTELRNQAVGLGGNTAFVTVNRPNGQIDGVAYRCP
jgi:hypothetical protein